ncbi:hypothetical protein VFPPC_03740 [Pochonia chlamydosporia 170]|uniref:Uncharacterized protein n=1 Tax=Pochonia chlamydosporia 170 TaxID=1380566 RepID=A0A179G0Q7_METCM|nr:hypothetical protein VFPPC_03740 [Pochonia chlamydosporia 170]OAQ71442.1 hypothetical protein VFPPC_03740 [Pochonia chlamydosporia 170]
MRLDSALTLLALGSGAFSFKIRTFTGKDCTGSAKEINIWDNTCRSTDIPTFKSFRVLAYGAHRQRAEFHKASDSWCTSGTPFQSYWADGGSDKFKKDKCLTLSTSARVMNSRSA